MSQPPPPPNQPPSGGFGAPQDPPPGGFGAPQSPPPGGFGAPQSSPPGGFGAPQTPPPPPQTPPQAPQTPPPPAQGPGYGYPQPQTPPQQPYGQPQTPPQQPYGQPQTSPGYAPQPGYGYPNQQPVHGYPQAPTFPMQQGTPASGGRKGPSAQVWIIVAAVTVIALIAGAGFWYTQSGSGDKTNAAPTDGPSGDSGGGGSTGGTGGTGGGVLGTGSEAVEKVPAGTSAKLLFQLPAPEIKAKGEIDSVAGSWLTDSVYVKAGLNQLVGYEPDTGAVKWTLPLGGQTCAGSHEITTSGIAAVVSESGKRTAGNHEPCSDVTAFEVATGKKLWTKSVKSGDQPVPFAEVAISGGTVAAGGGFGGGAAFDLTTGKVLWQPQPGSCEDLGYAGGEQLVSVRTCGDYDNATYEVQLLDPKTGKGKWSYKLPQGIKDPKVISTKPVVFGVDAGETHSLGVSDVFPLDDNGKLRGKITLEDGKYEDDCTWVKVGGCRGIVVGNDKLYVSTKQHEGSGKYGETNEVVSFSLATGKATGERVDAGDGYELFPIRMDGPNLLSYNDGPYDKGHQVVSIDGKTLKQTVLLETPNSDPVRSAISSMVPKSNELLYTNGRLFYGQKLISKPYSAKEKSYTALGFGAK